jgi:hypothetical protein
LKLEIHPEAARNFDKKAEELLTEIEARPLSGRRRQGGASSPDVHIAASIQPKDTIGDIEIQLTDRYGNDVAKTYQRGGDLVGLFGEGYKKLVRIAEGVQKTKLVQNAVSLSLLTDLIFDWLARRHQSLPVPGMTEYVLGECEKQIGEIEIWIPVFMLHVTSDVRIGQVTLRTITREMLDEWRAGYFAQATDDETRSAIEQFILERRGELQGFAAAAVKVVAEPRRASEAAFEQAERAVAMLRFFSPANFDPRIVSYCALLGRQHIDSEAYLTVRGGKLGEYNTGGLYGPEPSWRLSNRVISEIRANGLDTLSDLLNRERRTEFQQELLSALQLYSKSSLAKNVADKLVYILVALESLFLRDSSEAIMDNISERMAFFVGSTVAERKAIIGNVKRTYGLRSLYIHHGRNNGIDDMATLEEFMLTAWKCLQGLIKYAEDDGATKAKFLNDLEERKLS